MSVREWLAVEDERTVEELPRLPDVGREGYQAVAELSQKVRAARRGCWRCRGSVGLCRRQGMSAVSCALWARGRPIVAVGVAAESVARVRGCLEGAGLRARYVDEVGWHAGFEATPVSGGVRVEFVSTIAESGAPMVAERAAAYQVDLYRVALEAAGFEVAPDLVSSSKRTLPALFVSA